MATATRTHAHAHVEIGYVLDKRIAIVTGSDSCTLAADTVFIIPPRCVHHEAPGKGVARVLYAGLASVPERYITSQALLHASVAPSNIIKDLMFEMLAEKNEIRIHAERYMSSLAELLMIAAARACEKRAGVKPSAKEGDLMLRAADIADNRFRFPSFGVAELAGMLGLTARSLELAFRERSSFTPMSFIEHYRIRHAENMLRTDRTTIRTVSRACGFSSESYFIRRFKQLHGLTPRHYRKKYTAAVPDGNAANRND
ncbi:MAG: AraC family transcriptional regulator [Spirochaetes bacterium]|nr:AraC family transcriptional regulator [Spirochaetota bacterium]